MKLEHVLELIKAVSESKVTTFKYEEGETKILIRTEENTIEKIVEYHPEGTEIKEQEAADRGVPQGIEITRNMTSPEAIEVQCNVVTSPLVGTFYTAPSEDGETFVKIGDTVKKGQTLAIVEAMKLMNEIECEFDGIVAEILGENGKGVEYGQPLFVIR